MIPDEDLPMKMTPLPKKKTMMTMMKTTTTTCPVEPKRTGDEADCNPVPVFPPHHLEVDGATRSPRAPSLQRELLDVDATRSPRTPLDGETRPIPDLSPPLPETSSRLLRWR